MRLWTLHPKYLDSRGIVALWREALLAQAVLGGATRGYRHHPQLDRFRREVRPLGPIAQYLRGVHAESVSRGYRFDARKIGRSQFAGRLSATRGQVEYEWEHLVSKLQLRDPRWLGALGAVRRPEAHPIFTVRAGGVAKWEVQP